MKNTNLASVLVKTICALEIEVRRGKNTPYSQALIEETETIRPGFWLVERSSIFERRKEFGCFGSIVRFICFYQVRPAAELEYCCEDSDGNFIKWDNCDFITLINHDYIISPSSDWDRNINKERIANNLDWAKEAVVRHKLPESLEGEETIFYYDWQQKR